MKLANEQKSSCKIFQCSYFGNFLEQDFMTPLPLFKIWQNYFIAIAIVVKGGRGGTTPFLRPLFSTINYYASWFKDFLPCCCTTGRIWYLGIFFTQFKELETNLLDKLIIWNYKSERLLKRSIFWFRAELGNIFPYATWWNKMFTSSWHRSTSQFQPWDNHCNSNKWQTHN